MVVAIRDVTGVFKMLLPLCVWSQAKMHCKNFDQRYKRLTFKVNQSVGSHSLDLILGVYLLFLNQRFL